ncbi:MAG: hypothetical protein ACRBCK_08505 [Alphaproteobacteria bacterium]
MKIKHISDTPIELADKDYKGDSMHSYEVTVSTTPEEKKFMHDLLILSDRERWQEDDGLDWFANGIQHLREQMDHPTEFKTLQVNLGAFIRRLPDLDQDYSVSENGFDVEKFREMHKDMRIWPSVFHNFHQTRGESKIDGCTP